MLRSFLSAVVAALGLALATNAPADATTSTAVTLDVVGKGKIRLVVADGTSLPCDASGNRVLFSGHARAGEAIKVTSSTGSVCVDHTYGAMRESQWSGPNLWSGSNAGWTGARGLNGSVSTERP